jgi:hypothetical protein
MSEPIWSEFLTERDKAVFTASGYGVRGGFGKRPALLIIDVNWAFCGDRPCRLTRNRWTGHRMHSEAYHITFKSGRRSAAK